ncbi:hypothetical protein WICPIJ_006685 [Wickerhamomyces pijperi]|uniref:Uncharacterized protein n=1 Tax=Wickerhamomyces pijperi TaxID=599730 RepID=A0A9P8Q1L0_WICPI|nr:hypothetical protein WICPIJ_006685 [Wickerhamomyces pijperi]
MTSSSIDNSNIHIQGGVEITTDHHWNGLRITGQLAHHAFHFLHQDTHLHRLDVVVSWIPMQMRVGDNDLFVGLLVAQHGDQTDVIAALESVEHVIGLFVLVRVQNQLRVVDRMVEVQPKDIAFVEDGTPVNLLSSLGTESLGSVLGLEEPLVAVFGE